METYGVKEVSKLSGVTVRTLHHYDKIGLLKPCNRTEAGYRHYGEKELLRLQQILFYKELDFPLKEIGELLDNPDFNLIDALESHRSALKNRSNRIATLLATIESTINHLKKGKKMSKPEKLYEGLPKEVGTTYRKEAMETYGKDVVEHSENELLKLDKGDFEKLREDLDQILKELFARRDNAPENEDVQQLVARHYRIIRAFWGTSNAADKQAEAYKGLGQLYMNDPRYTAIGDEFHPEYAAFLQQAMHYFADKELE